MWLNRTKAALMYGCKLFSVTIAGLPRSSCNRLDARRERDPNLRVTRGEGSVQEVQCEAAEDGVRESCDIAGAGTDGPG